MVTVVALLILQLGVFGFKSGISADEYTNRTGMVSSSITSANVRSAPEVPVSPSPGNVITTVGPGQAVTVLQRVIGGATSQYGNEWYQIRFTKSGTSTVYEGYIVDNFITLDPVPVATPTPIPVTPDATFEAMLTEQRFPESYKPQLRQLHTLHPTWVFQSLFTNLDWNNVLNNENIPGRSLIESTNNDNWKSLDADAYNWLTNRWTVYDGSGWIAASRDLISYYMDPRNMLDGTRVYMFENLSYNPAIHTLAGVQAILAGSFMDGKSVTFNDPATGASRTLTYAQIFIEAAQKSGVSPYNLASRVRQEVGATSGSISGTVKDPLSGEDYTGYYNYFNIGANASTEPNGAVLNGLQFAKYGSDRVATVSANEKDYYIPWSDPYRSIVGGSIWIGWKYVNVGQNTLYFQKFDVINDATNGLYWHQYMANLMAPYSESTRISNAYTSFNFGDNAMSFIIPVYNGMPDLAAPKPAASGNPNNWLKSLTINGQSLTPEF